MAINGTHMLFYTSKAEELRAMLRDVFGFQYVDAHAGWLIFRLPPAEVGVHPAEGPTFDSGVRHQISFMCDDIHKTIVELKAKGVEVVGEPKTESYGITTTLRLPGGCDVMMYQPFHAIAADIGRPPSPKASAGRGPKRKAAAKKGVRLRQEASARQVRKVPKKRATAPRGRRAKRAPRRR
jgi:catechol 2,3-dioxygenase-like lactoylglutathione lyase family enzyme